MKTYVVQLERDDDFVSARDKMMWSKAPRILLVWPQRGRVLDREIDLVLLQRQGQKLGAQLAVVCHDDDVLTFARELKIPAFESVSQAQREAWKSPRKTANTLERPPARWTLGDLKEWKKNARQPLVSNTMLRLAAFFVGVLAVLGLGVFLLPGAEVSFKMAEVVQRVDFLASGSLDASTTTVTGIVPVRTTTVIVEGRDQITASGMLKLSDKRAEGEVVFTNLSDEITAVDADTVVLTLQEPVVRFRTLQAATLPSGAGETATVRVQAVLPGEAGNVEAGSILAVEGARGLSLKVNNLEPTTGGGDRDAPMPTELDLLRLRDRLLFTLEESARMDMERVLGESSILIADSLEVVEIILEQQEPAIGEPGDLLTLNVQVEFSAHYVERADLERAAQFALDAGLTKGYSADDASLELVSVRQMNAREWQVVAERKIRPNWQRETMIRSLLGAKPEDVGVILMDKYPLDSAPVVRLRPQWWPRLPYLPLRIQLEAE